MKKDFFGNRGASGEAPENIIAAFKTALRVGMDGIEIDVRLCKSGEVVTRNLLGLRAKSFQSAPTVTPN